MEYLFSKTINRLSVLLDYRSERHKIITSNIANIDTPGFIPKDLVFKQELKDAILAQKVSKKMTLTNPKHLPQKLDKISLDYFEVVATGDKVSLDKEMVNLAENHLNYNLNIDLLARRFRGFHNLFSEAK